MFAVRKLPIRKGCKAIFMCLFQARFAYRSKSKSNKCDVCCSKTQTASVIVSENEKVIVLDKVTVQMECPQPHVVVSLGQAIRLSNALEQHAMC
jgi:hypothetical protein